MHKSREIMDGKSALRLAIERLLLPALTTISLSACQPAPQGPPPVIAPLSDAERETYSVIEKGLDVKTIQHFRDRCRDAQGKYNEQTGKCTLEKSSGSSK